MTTLLAAAIIRPSFAKTEPSTALATADPVCTVERLRRMTYEEFAHVTDELTALTARVHDIMTRVDATNLRYDVVRDVARYHLSDAQNLLMRLVQREFARLDRTDGAGADPRLIEDALDALAGFAEFGESRPSEASREFDALIEFATARTALHPFGLAIDQRLRDARAAIDARFGRLPDARTLLAEKLELVAAGPRGSLERTREMLLGAIVGQDHIVDGVMAELWNNRVRGPARARGGTFVVMGMEGTGHGTIARALVRAINLNPTADAKHLQAVPVLQTAEELWTTMGAVTGHLGSEAGVPELIEWLVRHSGGKYEIKRAPGDKGGEKFHVVRNDAWKPGDCLDGYFRPEDGVLFFDDLHNWSKALKDKFLLPILAKRRFTLPNPNGGVTAIEVPVHVLCATNEGTGLLVPRDENGQRRGAPLDHARLLEKFERVRGNPALLKGALLESNGPRGGGTHRAARGNSEQLVGKVPDRGVFLTKPLSRTEREAIARRKLEELAGEMAEGGSDLIGPVDLAWTDAVVDRVASHGTIDEDNALGIPDRLESLVREPIAAMIQAERLRGGEVTTKIRLDVRPNADGTQSLVATVTADRAPAYEVDEVMRATLADRPPPPISDERIDELVAAGPILKSRVFGIDHIIERLTERALSVANAASARTARPATVIMMDGLSSTGKTQLTLEFAEAVLGRQDELLTIDFSRVQTLRAMEEQITGYRDEHGNVVKSRFMNAYDRGNGQVVVALDELANVADPRLLKVLYDLFRVNVMHTFADNERRPMTRVVLLVTGNATQHVYSNIPSDLPMDVQMLAWEEMHASLERNFGAVRFELAKTYPESLLTRVQRGNTFVMPPFNWKTLRQLTQLKLGEAIAQMRDVDGRRGWDVRFAGQDEYVKFVDTVIDEGFELSEQGASVEKFVANDVKERLEALLLREKVPNGARVVVREAARGARDDEAAPGRVTYELGIADRAEPLRFELPRRFAPKDLELDDNVLRKTAYHEAGHAIVTRVAYPDAFVPVVLSVKRGLTRIANDWLYHAGLAHDTQRVEMSITRDWVVRQIAVLLAGETAERLVTRGQAHASGKANDIERAADLAQNAILRYGLSRRWGVHAIPKALSVGEYLANLPERDKVLLRAETRGLVREGRRLAERILIANFDGGLVPLANVLVEKTKLDRADLSAFYQRHALVDPSARSIARRLRDWGRAEWRRWRYRARRTLNPEIIESLPPPAAIGNLKAEAEARQRELYAEVAVPADAPVAAWPGKPARRRPKMLPPPGRCAALLAPAG